MPLPQQLTAENIEKQLQSLLPHLKTLSSDDDRQHYGKDWTNFYPPAPSVIVFPRSTDDVKKIVLWANEQEIALVPSGGRTGLSGGACATDHEIVVSFDAMNRIHSFDPIEQTCVCEAGVITQTLQEFAQEKDFYYPVDFASVGSSQIGGNLGTNAGGIKVIRYGMTRDWVLGLTVVTGKGDVLHINQGLIKNATGYDLKNLFIGSEGTLGFIVEATIKLAKPPRDLVVMVLGLSELVSIYPVLKTFRGGLDLTAFEFFSDKAMKHVLKDENLSAPFDSPASFYAVIEFDQQNAQELETAISLFESCVENDWVIDGVISQSQEQYQKLWALRENISESIAPYKPYKNDIAVTISHVKAFLDEVDALVNQQYPEWEVIWFGHIGDGNLHLNILKPENLSIEDFTQRCGDVSQQIFKVVQKYRGSISAEHGVGLLKKDYLSYSRSPEEIEYMRAIKKVFDPKGILNPGKIFD
ncbi:MAG: FAD-binding oxidoreductase [Pseudomonadota bacterium]